MFNHLMKFESEELAKIALANYLLDGNWDWSCTIPGQRVVLARAVWDNNDPEAPILVSPEATLPGFFVTVSLPILEPSLRDLGDRACRLIGEGATGVLAYLAPDLDTGLLATAIIEPVPAGSNYIFG